jgi:hypothetical protein
MRGAPPVRMLPTDETPLPIAKSDVVYRALSEGAVLLSVHDEVYYGLNNVGVCLWEALPPVTRTFGAMCAHLKAHYPDVDPVVLRTDVEELLTELTDFGLVTANRATVSP